MVKEDDFSTLSIALSAPLSDQLDLFCKEQNLNESEAVEKIMESVLADYFSIDDKAERLKKMAEKE